MPLLNLGNAASFLWSPVADPNPNPNQAELYQSLTPALTLTLALTRLSSSSRCWRMRCNRWPTRRCVRGSAQRRANQLARPLALLLRLRPAGSGASRACGRCTASLPLSGSATGYGGGCGSRSSCAPTAATSRCIPRDTPSAVRGEDREGHAAAGAWPAGAAAARGRAGTVRRRQRGRRAGNRPRRQWLQAALGYKPVSVSLSTQKNVCGNPFFFSDKRYLSYLISIRFLGREGHGQVGPVQPPKVVCEVVARRGSAAWVPWRHPR
jgi:hypothetical protein